MKTLSTLLLALLSFFLSSSICNAFAFTPSPSRIGRKIVNVPKQNQINARRFISSPLFLSENDTNSIDEAPTVYTPADRPLLAVVDIVGLVIFALIGKSSHSADGSIDLSGVLTTAFPFVTAWLATSPLTGVYSPDDKGAMTTIIKAVLKGWAFAIPLGIVMRGVLKGYVPPLPFIIVTLISTLLILIGVRVLFNIAENFFVELV